MKGDLHWNLAAVAAGVRPAWLCEPGREPPARARAAARRAGLVVSADLTAGGEKAGFLVTRSAVSLPRGGAVTHMWLGKRLGLPCASSAPWGAEREVFAMLGIRRAGERAPTKQCGARSWAVRCAGTLTTFWCEDISEAQAWWNTLRSGVAAERFRLDELEPAGLELFFFCALESPKNV